MHLTTFFSFKSWCEWRKQADHTELYWFQILYRRDVTNFHVLVNSCFQKFWLAGYFKRSLYDMFSPLILHTWIVQNIKKFETYSSKGIICKWNQCVISLEVHKAMRHLIDWQSCHINRKRNVIQCNNSYNAFIIELN